MVFKMIGGPEDGREYPVRDVPDGGKLLFPCLPIGCVEVYRRMGAAFVYETRKFVDCVARWHGLILDDFQI